MLKATLLMGKRDDTTYASYFTGELTTHAVIRRENILHQNFWLKAPTVYTLLGTTRGCEKGL